MKIIICTRDLTAGAGQYTIALLNELEKSSEIKKILVIGPKTLQGFSNKIQFSLLKLRGGFFITKELMFAIKCKKKVEKALKEEKYDLIYTCHPFLIFNRFPIPFIVVFHGLHKGFLKISAGNWLIKLSKLFHFLYSYFDYKTIQTADKIVFVSNKTLKEARGFYPRYKNKFIHIPAFIDDSKFYPLRQEQKEKLREKYKLEKDRKYILYVGRLEPLKGIELLIETIRELREEGNKLELLVVGDGFLKGKVKSYSFVKYLGKIPHNRMNEIYNIADLFVLPSYYENCPLVVLEAMASGCLILASEVGDVKNILNNDKLILNSGNQQELKGKITELLSLNKEEKNKIIQTFVRQAKEKYDIKIISKKILDLYNDVAKK